MHQGLIAAGLRLRASLVVDTGEARDAHQIAALCAYGAAAVCPWLAYETIAALGLPDGTGQVGGTARYRLGLERGLLRIMSKMGVCTFSGYCGAQLFEILGLDRALVERYFPGTPSPLGGFTLEDVAAHSLARHRRAYVAPPSALPHHGAHGYRRGGDYHAVNPLVVKKLHRARAEGQEAYEEFATLVHTRPPSSIRDLLELAPRQPIPLDEVEPVDAICRRFFASAMSVGALAPEAHRAVAIAMNRLGARSNSGEGGEEPERFRRPAEGDWSGSRTKQVASARFGVTPAYLRSADELQIKIAQGSKPGEGGQLPGREGRAAHRAPAPRAAGDDAHLAAGAPRHLQHRGSGAAHLRPARRAPLGAHQREAGRDDRRRHHRGRRRQGGRRRDPDQRPRRRHGRVAAVVDQARRGCRGSSASPRRSRC